MSAVNQKHAACFTACFSLIGMLYLPMLIRVENRSYCNNTSRSAMVRKKCITFFAYLFNENIIKTD
jgi:hypothetical protein